jgi:hypothetical protein
MTTLAQTLLALIVLINVMLLGKFILSFHLHGLILFLGGFSVPCKMVTVEYGAHQCSTLLDPTANNASCIPLGTEVVFGVSWLNTSFGHQIQNGYGLGYISYPNIVLATFSLVYIPNSLPHAWFGFINTTVPNCTSGNWDISAQVICIH